MPVEERFSVASRSPGLALLAAKKGDEAIAAALAQTLELALLPTGSDPLDCKAVAAVLLVRGASLALQQTGPGAPGPVAVEFGSAAMRHRRRAGNNELLGRAVGLGKKTPLRVVDATAGLGRDSFVLADLGCDVLLCEREPVVAQLLRSGMAMARSGEDPWLQGVLTRMELRCGDARQMTEQDIAGQDVIYLDPMFPQRGKSAAVKKEMALLQSLLQPAANPQDADALMHWALQQDVARVVIKRPSKAPHLGEVQPSHCINGKSVRYDVHVRRKLA